MPNTKPTFYIGVVVRENAVVDLMVHDNQQESIDNLNDSPEADRAVTMTVWEVTNNGDEVRLAETVK